ncbi:MAG TPA: T9SS type A sorting domain-containing protein, partial [Chryseosolibacter sp.]|nr:T9SS type A sorting domain-containing protein [Chryseosolibacter sp.]
RTITSAARTLSAGPHKINLKYFEYDGTQTLIVQYYGPDTGNKWITIPNAAMKSGNPPSTTTNMTSSEDAIVMNEAQPDMRVSTFPNPTQQSNINVMIESEKQKTVQIMMMDFSGRTVYNQTFGTDELAAGMQVIPSEQLRRGMYLMIINDGENSIKQRISIQD